MIYKHIRSLLLQKDSVSIPGLGVFSLEYVKPEVDDKNQLITPPAKYVRFKWDPKTKDEGLLAYRAKMDKVSPSEAEKVTKKDVTDLLKKLDKGQKIEWVGLGEFSGDSKNVQFRSFNKNYHRGSSGMTAVKTTSSSKTAPAPKPVEAKKEEPKKVEPKKEELKKEEPKKVEAKKAEPKKEEKAKESPAIKKVGASAKKDEPKKVEPKKEEAKTEPVKVAPVISTPISAENKEDKKPDPVKPPVPKDKVETAQKPKEPINKEEEEKKGSLIWLWISLILILAASAIGLFVLNSDKKEPVKEVVQKEAPPPPPVKEEVVEEEPPPPPPKVITISQRSGRFYVVLGGFKVKENAYKLRDEIEAKGASDAKVVEPYGTRQLYRVSIEDYPSQAEAIERMKALRADYGNYIWVLTY